MAVWNIEIYSLDGGPISLRQTTIRFMVNMLIVGLAGLPLLQIYFSKEGLSINDRWSNTGLRKI